MPTTADILLRDHVRYTGDGLPNEPVGKPAPVGDPSSGVHNPSKKNLRDAVNSVVGAAEAANIAADRANEAADQIFNFRGRYDRMIARMMDGAAVTIAAYGDSTTDGTNTTDWTANPTNGSGNAVGSAAHAPANAWPAIAQSAARQMFNHSGVTFWNAGYGGRAIVDGWAADNLDAAIYNNPFYGTPDAVFLNFGINDARRASYTPELFRTELIELITLIDQRGSIPVLVTPDAASPADEANGAILSGLVAVMRAVAESHVVKLIDNHQAQLDMWAARGDSHRWTAEQSDGIHGDDNLHSLKGAYIAAAMFPNTLWLNSDPVVNVAPWSKYANATGLAYTRGDVTNTFGASMNVPAGGYTTGQSLQKLWVWNTASDRDLIWCSVDGDGYYSPRPPANGPVIGVYDYLAKANSTHASPTAGWIAPAGGRRASEAPGRLKRLPVGLTRLLFNAPTDNTSNSVYIGYFSFRRPKRIAQAHILTHAGTELKGADDWQTSNCPTVIGFGRGLTMDAFYQFSVSEKAGVFLWSGETFGGVSSIATPVRRGVMLFRNSDTQASLYDAHLYSDGTAAIVNGALATATVTAAFWDAGKVRVRGVVSGTDQIIRIYNGWTSNSAIMTSTIAITAAPVLWGGSPGAAFSNLGAAGTTLATCDLVAVEYS